MKINKTAILFPIFIFLSIIAIGQEERNLLSSYIETEKQEKTILDSLHYNPFDKEDIKMGLVNLPDNVKIKIIENAEEALAYTWPVIPATAYLEFVRSGNREVMEQYYNERLNSIKSLVLAELLENEGRFMDGIINACWAICEQSSWVLSAHVNTETGGMGIPNVEDPYIDLGAGEIAASLAWAYHFFNKDFNEINPLLKDRIPYEINKRIIQPYLNHNDFWWMALDDEGLVNNWNPWVNYNVVLSTFLMGDEVDDTIKQEVLAKSLLSVDQFINYFNDDGASEEGPNYWSHAGGKMLEYLELVQNISGGKIAIGNRQIIENIGRYIMEVHIFDDYYVNFADSSVRAHPDAGILYRYGKYINDPELLSFASFVAQKENFYKNLLEGSMDIALHNLLIYEDLKSIPPEKENNLSFWFDETEIAIGRTHKKAKKGFFFAAKGGHNAESHNHNDVGTFILYHQGQPLIVDIGVETYTAKTFSDERYEIWTMQSNFHNLPKINGFSQSAGGEFESWNAEFKNKKSKLIFSLDISHAYPEAAECEYWNRSYTLKRRNPELIIKDEFKLKDRNNATSVHFIAALLPKVIEEGKIKLKEKGGKKVFLLFSEDNFKVAIEELKLEDEKLLKAWQRDKLYRIILTSKEEELSGLWTYRIVED